MVDGSAIRSTRVALVPLRIPSSLFSPALLRIASAGPTATDEREVDAESCQLVAVPDKATLSAISLATGVSTYQDRGDG